MELVYTMDCHEFDQLVAEHLGVEIPDHLAGKNDGYSFQQNQNTWAEDFPGQYPGVSDSDPYNQNTYVEFRPEDWEGEDIPIDYGLNERYVWALYQKGVLPKDHKLVIRVWW